MLYHPICRTASDNRTITANHRLSHGLYKKIYSGGYINVKPLSHSVYPLIFPSYHRRVGNDQNPFLNPLHESHD